MDGSIDCRVVGSREHRMGLHAGNASLRRLAAVESAAINNTMLVQIAIFAWVFLGESPGVIGGFGIAIVSVGVLLAQGIRFRVIREAIPRNVR